ncbi:MAG: response regulator [Bacteroidota bacterium]
MLKPETKKVLLVDDEPNILVPLEFLMKQQGYQVEKAQNGIAALDKMKKDVPNIVILDVMMPGMTGFEVAKQIRAQPKFEDTRIVFLTAKGTPEDKMNGYSNGGEIYITKPFDNSDLVTKVNELIEFG